MTSPTRPLSIRLTTADIEQLFERAKRISGTPTGVARELILSGLSDGDPYAQAQRLLKIERRLAVVSQDLSATNQSILAHQRTSDRIEAMFEELLQALSDTPEEGHSHAAYNG